MKSDSRPRQPMKIPAGWALLGPFPEELPPSVAEHPLTTDQIRELVNKTTRKIYDFDQLNEFRTALLWRLQRLRSFQQLTSPKLAKEKLTRLQRIEKAITELQKQLGQNDLSGVWARQNIGFAFSRSPSNRTKKRSDAIGSFRRFLADLEFARTAAQALQMETSGGPTLALSRSPVEWFVAVQLPYVFEEYLDLRVTYGHGTEGQSEAQSPYIEFAFQVLQALGVTNKGKPYRRNTIARALTSVRTGKVRRRISILR
jgi:hypothetical protein